MNKYELHVGNAVISCEGFSPYSAMEALTIFRIGNMIEYVRAPAETSITDAWIYQIEVMGKLQIAYIKRVA